MKKTFGLTSKELNIVRNEFLLLWKAGAYSRDLLVKGSTHVSNPARKQLWVDFGDTWCIDTLPTSADSQHRLGVHFATYFFKPKWNSISKKVPDEIAKLRREISNVFSSFNFPADMSMLSFFAAHGSSISDTLMQAFSAKFVVQRKSDVSRMANSLDAAREDIKTANVPPVMFPVVTKAHRLSLEFHESYETLQQTLAETRQSLSVANRQLAELRAEQSLESWDANEERKVAYMTAFWRMAREYNIEPSKCPGIACLSYSAWLGKLASKSHFPCVNTFQRWFRILDQVHRTKLGETLVDRPVALASDDAHKAGEEQHVTLGATYNPDTTGIENFLAGVQPIDKKDSLSNAGMNLQMLGEWKRIDPAQVSGLLTDNANPALKEMMLTCSLISKAVGKRCEAILTGCDKHALSLQGVNDTHAAFGY